MVYTVMLNNVPAAVPQTIPTATVTVGLSPFGTLKISTTMQFSADVATPSTDQIKVLPESTARTQIIFSPHWAPLL